MANEQGQEHSFTATRTNLTEMAHDIKLHNDDKLVKVEVAYPAKYEGEKFYKDGDVVWLSRESADAIIEAGIGTETKRSKDEQSGDAPTGSEANADKLDAKKVTGTQSVKADDSVAATVASKKQA